MERSKKLINQALDIAKQLFCHSKCNLNCQIPCANHHLPHTVKQKYITLNNNIELRIRETPIHPLIPSHPPYLLPPLNIKNNPIRYPIHSMLDHKENKTKDKYKIIKKYQTYLCQWNLPNNITYNKWMPQRKLFPSNRPMVIQHNTFLLVDYSLVEKLSFVIFLRQLGRVIPNIHVTLDNFPITLDISYHFE